jgi:hypothetical protein
MANDTLPDSAQTTEGLDEQTKVGDAKKIGGDDVISPPPTAQRIFSRRTLLKRGLQGAVAFTALSKVVDVLGSLIATPQTPTLTESPKPSPSPTVSPIPTIGETETAEPQPTLGDLSIYSPENVAIPDSSLYSPEEAAIIMDIEATYGINIFSVQQAREYAHRYLSNDEIQTIKIDSWQDTKKGFNKEQLILLRDLLSYVPKVLLTPKYPQRFGIILRGDDLEAAGDVGAVVGFTRMICVGKDTINLSNRMETFSFYIHELTHSYDLSLGEIPWLNVEYILGNKNFGDLPDMKAYFAHKGGTPSSVYSTFTPVQKAALATFSSFALVPPGQEFIEGIAGIASLYVNGKESFMNAVGPLLDGDGYTSSDYQGYITDVDILLKKYPKAYDLYLDYKYTFFGLMEYDETLLKAIKGNN